MNMSSKHIVMLSFIISIVLATLSLISLYRQEVTFKEMGLLPTLLETGAGIVYLLSLLIFTINIILNILLIQSKFIFLVQMFYTAFLLFSLPVYIEPLPRFRYTYFAYSFSDFILKTGTIDSNRIFYHNWPSFSILGAYLYLIGLPTKSDQFNFLRIYPLIITLIYMGFVYLIFLKIEGKGYKKYIAVLLFPMLNWINQSYFSPQSLGFLLWLLMYYLLLANINSPKEIYFALMLVLIGLITTHFLSSLVAGGFLLLLFIMMNTRRIPRIINIKHRTFIIFVLLFVSWSIYFSYDYLRENIHKIVDNFQVFLKLGLSSYFYFFHGTLARAQGDYSHVLVAKAMIIFAILSVILAIFGFIQRIRYNKKLETTDILFTLAEISILTSVIVVGSYGNELLIRVFLFSIPAFVYYISELSASHLKVLLIIFLLISPFLHIFVHYGNERYDHVTLSEIQGIFFIENKFSNSNDSIVIKKGSPIVRMLYILKNYKPSAATTALLIFDKGFYELAKMYGEEEQYYNERKKCMILGKIIYASRDFLLCIDKTKGVIKYEESISDRI
ncbi:hypothetical protein [Thermococcus thioreducens]|uniref:Uncharacterized protein n=1 Tax=Thermococcus thioreducens TaxID=277988 RepID=A0A0Q2M1T2_9EURY|nr:hypothetical protein [Thermococcus thioreducens]ASJ11576.1 hypothetical protein A3L14_01125 [Thermococcus thioreducens]KQH81818.1 hypothetical protein AMR53_08705 [Thermococcus thioreducens]SEW04169.1 hypothetical protein SAMN05216170_1205 [Thermococcus thioreducens]